MTEEAIFRSADMSLIQLYIPTDICRDVVYALGRSGTIQFRDLNSKVNAFQRAYVKEIRRLDNVERQYRYFKQELTSREIELKPAPFEDDGPSLDAPVKTSDIDEYVKNAQLLEQRLSQLVDSTETLELRKKDLQQFRAVLHESEGFFSNATALENLVDIDTETIALQANNSFVTGIIPRSKINVLQKILWRVLRGNLYFRSVEVQESIYEPKTKTKVDKDVFIVFSHGREIIERITKIAESLDADIYDIGPESSSRTKTLEETNDALADLTVVLETTTRTLYTELFSIGEELSVWAQVVRKEKSVYETLNLFQVLSNRSLLTAEGWIPTNQISKLKQTLETNTTSDQHAVINVLSTKRTPPTYHKTNKFTDAFQNIVDAYGIAQYKEVNPGLPTIVTFPFMFAIMFGDIGHGIILSLAALMLVIHEKKIARIQRDEIFDMAYSGRYILLMMGIFSIVTGFFYNDIFSKSLTLFKSGWEWPEHDLGETIFAKKVGTYPAGLDPAWHGTENALLFTNSYKMKLSILMGFIHMTYSYFFSLVNYLNFHSWIDVMGNFVPGLLFMQSIFGYLSVCIVWKWSIDWIAIEKPAPGLLNMLISMFLSPGVVEERLYGIQEKVQVFLLFLALICVPWLLLSKPLYLKYEMDKKAKAFEALASTDEEGLIESAPESHQQEEQVHDDDDEDHEEHNFGDIMIHQVIHTIEFCLNSVSHTASYLRLWALSLAHAQLSTVLWSMTIQGAFGQTGVSGVIATVFLFGMWFILTCVILVIMEGTSAMLHSLRLHWVESMSKFFVGGGKYYEPYNFKSIVAGVDL